MKSASALRFGLDILALISTIHTMTKKYFIKLADMLKGSRPNPENTQAGSPMRDYTNGRLAQWENMRDLIGKFCYAQNPAFDLPRWLDYIDGKCGPSGGKISK